MKKKRDRQAPTSIGKTSAHRSFLFLFFLQKIQLGICHIFMHQTSDQSHLQKPPSFFFSIRRRARAAGTRKEGWSHPRRSRRNSVRGFLWQTRQAYRLQYTHWHAVQPRTAHSCGSEAYAQAQLAVAKPVAATARCLNGHCSRIPSVLARVKKNGDLGGSKLFFFFFFRMRSDRHRNSGQIRLESVWLDWMHDHTSYPTFSNLGNQ